MANLRDTPSLQGLLPCQAVVLQVEESAGICHDIHQHEGGEQGEPLMPLQPGNP